MDYAYVFMMRTTAFLVKHLPGLPLIELHGLLKRIPSRLERQPVHPWIK